MKLSSKRPRAVEIALKACFVLFGVIVLSACLFAFWTSIESKVKSERFDSSRWNQDTGDVMWPNRLRMVDDILDSRILIGKSKDEIARTLGRDDKESGYFREWNSIYRLGPERGFIRMDSEWLVIKFDQMGVCVEAAIKRD